MKTLKNRTKVSDFFPDGYEPSEGQGTFALGVLNYRKTGIEIEELEWDEEVDGFFNGITRKVKITQKRLINGYILNQKQLVDRAKSLYQNLGWQVKIIPVVYSLDVEGINIEWIENQMEEFGIKRNDLVKQLAIDKSSLSLYLSGKRGMDKSQKAAFFYYFLTYELNRDFRENL